ncbi:MAG6790 family protein [Mycoplasmopsis felis]
MQELEGLIKGFRRGQKHGVHTQGNEKIEIIRIWKRPFKRWTLFKRSCN